MEKKHYNTAGRTRLADHLKRIAAEPPKNADDIYAGLLTACAADGSAAPGRSSVYRMLATMTEEGEVAKFPAGKDENGYVYQYVGNARACSSHFHLHCLVCGNVTHLECACGTEIAGHLLATHGFDIDRGRSVLYGTCAACTKKEG
ncbi:MAG: transcriptional repressor [Clostridia bacterium]|nr:transcriptional repressor [Clostridia bacterium]